MAIHCDICWWYAMALMSYALAGPAPAPGIVA